MQKQPAGKGELRSQKLQPESAILDFWVSSPTAPGLLLQQTGTASRFSEQAKCSPAREGRNG